jgi:hypothetical protein
MHVPLNDASKSMSLLHAEAANDSLKAFNLLNSVDSTWHVIPWEDSSEIIIQLVESICIHRVPKALFMESLAKRFRIREFRLLVFSFISFLMGSRGQKGSLIT